MEANHNEETSPEDSKPAAGQPDAGPDQTGEGTLHPVRGERILFEMGPDGKDRNTRQL